MRVLSVICESRSLFAFEPSFELFSSFLNELKYSDVYYVIVEHNNILYSSHLNTILNNIPSDCRTWTAFETYLTVGILVGTKKLSPRCRYMWSMDMP